MKIHLKYIYVGILAILVLWSGFNIYNGYHKLNVEKAAIAKQAENMDTLVSQSIKACYKAYDDVHATQEEKDFYENIRKELDFNWTPTLKLVNKGETISEYTYLSEDYYEIKDSKKKEQAKEKYVEDFKTWMSNIYE